MPARISQGYAQQLNSGLTTERLLLEPLTSHHAEHLFLPLQDPVIYEWISSVPPHSLEILQNRWKGQESRIAPEGNEAWLNWAVRLKNEETYIGKLDAEVRFDHVATNIGYLFFPDHWGRGYASEAVFSLTNHLAASGVSKMFATVTEGNRASYRVLENSGFVRNRIIPDNDTIRGVKFNDVEFIWLPQKLTHEQSGTGLLPKLASGFEQIFLTLIQVSSFHFWISLNFA